MNKKKVLTITLLITLPMFYSIAENNTSLFSFTGDPVLMSSQQDSAEYYYVKTKSTTRFFSDMENMSSVIQMIPENVEVQVFEGKVVLGARVKVGNTIPVGKNVLKASFLYQACDDVSCMAPETLEFEIPFQVVPASSGIKKINQEIFDQIKFR